MSSFIIFCTFLVLLQFCKMTRNKAFSEPRNIFSDVSLPNHTKMFELVHMVTSMEDFGLKMPPPPPPPPRSVPTWLRIDRSVSTLLFSPLFQQTFLELLVTPQQYGHRACMQHTFRKLQSPCINTNKPDVWFYIV